MRTIPITMLLLLLACSCKKKADEATPAKGSAATAAKPEPKPEVPAIGLTAKDNDPAVVTLAKAAITCKADGNRLEWDCEGFKAWRDAMGKDPYKYQRTGDTTFVNFLEDPDEKVRFLGANELDGFTPDGKYHTYAEDPAAAKRVLAAAQKEKSVLVAEKLGNVLGDVDLKKAGIKAEVTKLIAEHPLMELRLGLIQTVTDANQDEMLDVILPLATGSTDDKIRAGAQSAFDVKAGKEAPICQMWLDNVDHANADIAGSAATICGREALCKAHWDKLLDKLDGKAKAGTVNHGNMVQALKWIHDGGFGQEAKSAPHQARAKAVAQATLKNGKNGESPRAAALEFLVEAGDKGIAAKFKKDPHGLVQHAAEQALKKK